MESSSESLLPKQAPSGVFIKFDFDSTDTTKVNCNFFRTKKIQLSEEGSNDEEELETVNDEDSTQLHGPLDGKEKNNFQNLPHFEFLFNTANIKDTNQPMLVDIVNKKI